MLIYYDSDPIIPAIIPLDPAYPFSLCSLFYYPSIFTFLTTQKSEFRRVPVPPHRLTPLKKDWLSLYTPLVSHMKLQVRMNLKAKAVELRTCDETTDTGALQKGADFMKAYTMGFQVDVQNILTSGCNRSTQT